MSHDPHRPRKTLSALVLATLLLGAFAPGIAAAQAAPEDGAEDGPGICSAVFAPWICRKVRDTFDVVGCLLVGCP